MSDGFTDAKSIINNNCQITIPETMLKKLGFEKGDVLRLTATENLIVIEKCETEMEILVDSNPEMKEDFSQELAALATVVFP